MREIMRVTADRRTLYVRLPRAWAKSQQVKKGDYLVMTEVTGGAVVVRKFDDEVSEHARAT